MKYLAILLMMGASSVMAETLIYLNTSCDEPQFSPNECDGPTTLVIDCDEPQFSPSMCGDVDILTDCSEPQFSPSPCDMFTPEPEEDDCVAHREGENNCGEGGGLGGGNGTNNENPND